MTDAERYATAATCRVRAAEQLRRMEMHSGALLLLREACLLAIRAQGSARFGHAGRLPDDVATILGQCSASSECTSDADVAPIDPALGKRLLEAQELDPVSAAKLPSAELLQRITELNADISRLLQGRARTASPRWSQTQVGWVVGIISAALLAVLLVSYARLFPNNIALNKRVTTNGVASFGTTTPYAIIDGRTYGPLAYHSDSGPDRSVTIDLGRVYRISGGEVWGRHDGPFDQSMPLALEVSDDDDSYRIVATRSEPFEAHAPWKLGLSMVDGRYVRLRVLRNSVLVLNEVRLFGHPVRR